MEKNEKPLRWWEEDEDLLTWWEKDEVVNYPNPVLHPDFAGCSPTCDVDVIWFRVEKSTEWNEFSFEFFEVGKFFIGYRSKEDGSLYLSVGASGIDRANDLDDIYPLHRCSIWLADDEGMENNKIPPDISFRFNIFNGFHFNISFKEIPEKAFIGFYSIDWY